MAEELARTKPRIAVGAAAEGQGNEAPTGNHASISVTAWMMQPGDDKVVAERIYGVLTAKRGPTIHRDACAFGERQRPLGRGHRILQQQEPAHAVHRTGRQLDPGAHQGDFTVRDLVGMIEGNEVKLRIVTVDVRTGATSQYAYQLTTGSGVSEILAINNHEFLLDERDGKGLGDGSVAKVKQLFRIDLAGAQNIAGKSGDLSAFAVPKVIFLDLVPKLAGAGLSGDKVPAKIEGIAFGEDIAIGGVVRHTLFIANDNDFTPTAGGVPNLNQYFVFAFDDADLPGFQQQKIRDLKFLECGIDF